MLLIVAATEGELSGLARDGAAGLPGHVPEMIVCGVGPVDAAARTAARLAAGDAGMPGMPVITGVVNIGIAGCRRAGAASIGDVVVGTAAQYCDTASPLVEQRVVADAALLAAVRAALPDALALEIGTSADVGGTSGCEVEAMEGFGVLRAAALVGVPAIEVRVVSNEIEEEDRALWQFGPALERLAGLLPTLVTALA